MSCVGLLAVPAGAPHHSSASTGDCHEDDHTLVQYAQRSRMIGGPLMTEAAQKVDKCLARLQSLQGTVTIPAPALSATVSACISPAYSRSKSCIGSPKFEREEKEPVIRVHDILRFSDDFTGKFPPLTQEHRGKYLRRLSRSKTEVFDDRKDPRDPHGEWKHWSSGAGDVHKVVSEILMASQIAKEITSMVNACLVNTETGSSEDEKPTRRLTKHKHKLKAQASSSNKGVVTGSSKGMLRKEDPMHKFRVRTPSDGSKRRHNSGNRKEVLYPKSKLTADLIRSIDSTQEVSSTERKMQSRRSPGTSLSPRISSRSKGVAVPAEFSKASATPRPSVEEFALKSNARVTGKFSRTAATPRTSMEDPALTTHLRLAGESSRAAATTSFASMEELSVTHAKVATVTERGVGTARARVEESFLRNPSKNAVSMEPEIKDPVLMRHARVAAETAPVERTPRSSVEELLSRSDVRGAASAEPSGASEKLRASNNDLVLQRIRGRVAAQESSSVLETPCTAAEDHISTRSYTHSSLEEPVLRNHARSAAQSTLVAGTSRSSASESLSRNKFRVAAFGESSRAVETPRASDNDPVLTRIRTRVAGAKYSSAPGTPHTSLEDPFLTRIRSRVAAAAEPIRGSIEDPLSKLRSRAAATTPSKSGATSDMWEAKEITNCYNSPRAIGESSKKSANAVKKVRNSRSPPQASQTSVEPRLTTSPIAGVQSSRSLWLSNQSPSAAISSGMPEASGQEPQLTKPESRSRIGRLPQDTVAEGSLARVRRTQEEPTREPRIATGSTSNYSSTRFPSAVKKSSLVAETNGDSTHIEVTYELPNDTIHPTSARRDNGSAPSSGSLKGGKTDDWFRLEATEISLGPNKLWKSGNNKAVLFSNPTFGPASPPGRRNSWVRERSPTPARQPSPRRSTSATRRMREWVGNVFHGRRPLSPDIAERLGNSSRKVVSLSPGRSLPSLITRLPSRGQKKPSSSSSAPRASVFPSSVRKEPGELPLPPCRQAQQLAASKLTERSVAPVRPVMELKAHKEKMDRQAHQMAAQKLMMVEDWNRAAEPPAPFEKDVGVAYRPGPVLYSKRQLNDMGCNAKQNLKPAECNSVMPHARYSREPETNLPRKEEEMGHSIRRSGWDNEVGVLGVLSQCRNKTQEKSTIAALQRVEKEKARAAAVDCAVQGGGVLRKSLSTGTQRSTSTIRAMSTGKIRTGSSFLKRAKDWMRTQTPFRYRPQETTDFS